jgi:hypothetical protein
LQLSGNTRRKRRCAFLLSFGLLTLSMAVFGWGLQYKLSLYQAKFNRASDPGGQAPLAERTIPGGTGAEHPACRTAGFSRFSGFADGDVGCLFVQRRCALLAYWERGEVPGAAACLRPRDLLPPSARTDLEPIKRYIE